MSELLLAEFILVLEELLDLDLRLYVEASILDFLAFLTFFVKSLSLSALADTSSLTGVFFQIGMPMNIGTSSLSDHRYQKTRYIN